MHVAMFLDQHPDTLGGMQTSVRLQRQFLEASGHQVTLVSPALRGRQPKDDGIVELSSVPLGPGEYSLCVPGRATDRALHRAMAARPPVDVVHVQADFWQAVIGYRFAAAVNAPVVHTMHNRLDVGIEATMPFPGLVQHAFGALQRRFLDTGLPAARDAWTYLARFTDRAERVTAPSSHFGQLLQERGVFDSVDVVSNGLDDAVALELLGVPKPGPRTRPRLAWVGRFSAEKRLLPFLEAVDRSGIDAEIHIFGDGGQRRAAEVRAAGIAHAEVVFRGKVPYRRMLAELRDADALVQTSQGFETQGMTVFEALVLGTPSLLSDHRIAADLPEGSHWTTGDDSVEALAATLAQAVTELREGTGPDLGGAGSGHFLQSRQTAAMVEVYRRALAGHATRARSGAAPGPRP
ncbi:glycosyltransferase [Arthrobacter ginkgonis]|uniref:Glycosyltransferase n=2 Tax=Arthrobacter ginkgonis TaxID=1630594 RepID=A0ABP7CT93_9MICC